MQTKASIRNTIVNLSGPAGDHPGSDIARKTLSWVLGDYGDQHLTKVLFDVNPPITEDDAKADLAGEPRPDNPTPASSPASPTPK